MKTKIFHLVFCILGIYMLPALLQAQSDSLETMIQNIIRGKKAQIGVAVLLNGKKMITVNDSCRYPMMSVFKLHQALAVADSLHRGQLPLDTKIYITKDDLKPNTYSPLREKYPNGEISMSIAKLLTYTLQQSDNNACDILFTHFGGPKATEQYIRSLGLEQFALVATEDSMHKSINVCYENWTYPSDAAKLLDKLLSQTLFKPVYQEFIKQTMIECQTGKDRLIKPLLNIDAIVGHKTGTGDKNAKGQLIGINDVGFVLLPNGNQYTIAVLIKDSEESMDETSIIISDISNAVYRYVKTNSLSRNIKEKNK